MAVKRQRPPRRSPAGTPALYLAFIAAAVSGLAVAGSLQEVHAQNRIEVIPAGMLSDHSSWLLDGATGVEVFTIGSKTYAAVIAYQDDGLQIVDISNPSDPYNLAKLENNGSRLLDAPYGVDIFKIGSKTYAAIASRFSDGLQIVDISNPSSPAAVGKLGDNNSRLLDGAHDVDVFTIGSKTYAAVASLEDDGLQIVDVSNPSSPTAVGKLGDNNSRELDGARGVDVFTIGSKTYAAVAANYDDGLQIVDVSNPSSPTAVGKLGDNNSRELDGAIGVAVFTIGSKTYAAVASFEDRGLQIVDVSDPSSPAAVGKLENSNTNLLDGATGVDVFVMAGRTYAAVASAFDNGLQIVDVSNPSSPTADGKLKDNNSRVLGGAVAVDIFMMGDRTYAAVASDSDDGLQLIQLRDRIKPGFVSAALDENTGLMMITLDEPIDTSDTDLSKLYVSDAGRTNEVVLTGATFDDTVPDLDTITFTLTNTQLDDIIPMATPQLDIAAGAVEDLAANAIDAAPDNAITTASPDSPIPSGRLTDSPQVHLDKSRSVDVFTLGGKIYAVAVSSTEDAIQIVDISSPDRPRARGSLDTTDSPTLLLDGARAVDTFTTGGKTYAVVASHADDGIQIVRVSDLTHPQPAGRLDDNKSRLLDGANGVNVFRIGTGIYAAVTSQYDGGLQIIDVTNPDSPTEAGKLEDGTFRLLDDTTDVDTFRVGGSTYAVVSSWVDKGIQIVDVSNPDSPRESEVLKDNNDLLLDGIRAVDAFEVGGTAYAAVASHTDGGLQIIDVSNPASPAAAGKLADTDDLLLGGASGVEIFRVGKAVYAAVASQYDGGLQIVDVSDPDNPTAAGSLEDGPELSLAAARNLSVFTHGGDLYAAVVSDTEGLQIVKLAEDDLEFVSATLDAATGKMTVTFTKTIDVSDTKLSKMYVSDAGKTNEVVLSGATFDKTTRDSETISLTLVPAQLDDITRMAAPQLDIAAGAVSDVSGNDIAAASDNPVTVAIVMTPVGNISDDHSLLLDSARAVDTFTIGSRIYAAVAASSDDGLQLVDISDPSSPIAAGHLEDTEGSNELLLDGSNDVNVFVIGSRTYAAVTTASDHGLQIVDVSNPSSPTAAGKLADNSSRELKGATGVAVFTIGGKTYAAVAASSDDGLQLVDISDPTNPTAAGNLGDTNSRLLDGASDVAVFTIGGKTYAAVASSASDDGLQLVDISDPTNPTAAGQLAATKSRLLDGVEGLDIFTTGGKTYAVVTARFDDALQIIDITDPDKPVAAGNLVDGGNLRLGSPFDVDVFTLDGKTYAAVTSFADDTLQIIDVTNPAGPAAAGSLRDGGSLNLNGIDAVNVFTVGADTYAAVAAQLDDGLQMVRLSSWGTSNTPPVAPSATATTAEDTSVTITPNISDPDTSDTPRISAVENPPNGTVIHDDTTITYTPDQGYTGTDTFGYTVTDGTDSVQGTVTVTVTRDNNTSKAISDLLSIYHARPDLQAAYPEAGSNNDMTGLLRWAWQYGIVDYPADPNGPHAVLGPHAHTYALLSIYDARPDLQAAYPEVVAGDRDALTVWARDWGINDYPNDPVGPAAVLGPHAHTYALLSIYDARPDLQAAYPEVVAGDRDALTVWARDWGINDYPNDPVGPAAVLGPHAHTYALLSIYDARPDLQAAYPEVVAGDHTALTVWARDWGINDYPNDPVGPAAVLGPHAHTYALLSIYDARPDLQAAYPEVVAGDHTALTVWARDWGINDYPNDPVGPAAVLGPHAHTYALLSIYDARPDLQAAYPEVVAGDHTALTVWARDWGINDYPDDPVGPAAVLGPHAHTYALLSIYDARPDLQAAYPEAASGDMAGLTVWARDWGINDYPDDPVGPAAVLGPHAHTYALLSIYDARPDLQAAYPEAASGDMAGLTVWARDWGINDYPDDPVGPAAVLGPYAHDYGDD